MAGAQLGTALWHVQRLLSEGSVTGLSDTQLLGRFAARRDETAFEAILARHGPMVLAVCRAILRDRSAADDAFQATFLVLARKASSAWAEGQLGGWLHKVAYRIAVRASANAARRRSHERRAAQGATVDYIHVMADDDISSVLHEEVARLPAKLRLPVVLCYLEGFTHTQAAVELGCGEATVRRRLVAARERLRTRLVRRGLVPTAAALGACLASEASATVSPVCAQATLRAAMRIAAGEALAVVASARVRSFTRGALTLTTNGSKVTAFAVLSLAALASLASGVGAGDGKKIAPVTEAARPHTKPALPQPHPVRVDRPLEPPAPAALTKPPDTIENWPMSLADSLRIALENSDLVRVFTFSVHNLPIGGLAATPFDHAPKDRQTRSARIVIGRAHTDSPDWRFKTEVMAHCRAVEEQYWNLVQANVQRESAESAAKFGGDILQREVTERDQGRGTTADVAEASQRLEQFNLDLMVRTSDLITVEHQFRHLLGLTAADNRRIIPVTPPAEAYIEPDWQTCLREMGEHQPEIVLIKAAIGEQTGPGTDPSRPEQNGRAGEVHERTKIKKQPPNAPTGQQQEILQQAISQRTRALSRFFREVEASYKQFTTASRLRAAAAQRLDAQRAYDDEGRITIDRLLDACTQYYNAIATESQFKTSYNVAIANLEESKGTLLEYDQIKVVEEPRHPGGSGVNSKNDSKTDTTSFEPPATCALVPPLASAALAPPPVPSPVPRTTTTVPIVNKPMPTVPPPVPSAVPSTTTTVPIVNKPMPTENQSPRSWSFSFSIGRDSPWVIKGTVSETTTAQPGADGH